MKKRFLIGSLITAIAVTSATPSFAATNSKVKLNQGNVQVKPNSLMVVLKIGMGAFQLPM
jgi:hypothetical protein